MTPPASGAADVVVIGGGVVGAATARALAGRGASVALLEQGSLAAAAGSSRGSARIVAPAAYPDREYLEMGVRALEQWRSLEASGDSRLLELTGALYVGAAAEQFARTLVAADLAHELLSAAEVAARFGIEGIDAEPVLFQRDAGVIRADRARDSLIRSAVELGARMHEHERVIEIADRGGGAELRTTRGSRSCDRVVVVAGPWTPPLAARLGIELPLTVSAQLVAYFRPPAGVVSLPAVMEFDGDEPYALHDPERGLKAAFHRRGPELDPDHAWELSDRAGLAALSDWVGSRFPGIDARIVDTETCLYTNTEDERFILRREGSVVIGSACSGQGFQLAPASGEALAELALEPG